MTIRAVALFVHIVGMLALFIGLAVEWLSLGFLRRVSSAEPAASWAGLHSAMPRVYGIASALLVASGIYLAVRFDFGQFAWVRLSLGLLIVMAALGASARAQARAIYQAAHELAAADVRRHASHPWVQTSLFLRAALGLAAVYLMIAKPVQSTSLLVIGGALAVGIAASVMRSLAAAPALGAHRHARSSSSR